MENSMNRLTARMWIGAGLVVLGLLLLVERFGFLHGIAGIFWGLAFVAGGAWFLFRFVNNARSEWWAAIPGFALLGIGAESLLSPVVPSWSGFFVLGALGLGFLTVYVSDRQKWWALIPGGVLLTLALNNVVQAVFHVSDTGGFFLLGLGLTFVVLAVLASLQWAWIPGVVLLVLGTLIGMPMTGGLNFVWPAALILGGLLLILQFVRKR